MPKGVYKRSLEGRRNVSAAVAEANRNRIWSTESRMKASVKFTSLWRLEEFRESVISGQLESWESEIRRATQSESLRGNKNAQGFRHTEETKLRLYEALKKRGATLPHVRLDGSVQMMRSSWEVFFAKRLDEIGLDWSYEPRRFPYEDAGRVRHYTPDFFVAPWDSYIEIHPSNMVTRYFLFKLESVQAAGCQLYLFTERELEVLW
jgi:hypothetical protein